jgi:hypothetical protein
VSVGSVGVLTEWYIDTYRFQVPVNNVIFMEVFEPKCDTVHL